MSIVAAPAVSGSSISREKSSGASSTVRRPPPTSHLVAKTGRPSTSPAATISERSTSGPRPAGARLQRNSDRATPSPAARRSLFRGHEDQFRPLRLSARYRLREGTFAGPHDNGREAPIPA